MNLSNIINEIANSDPEFFERTSERRSVIKNWSRKIALTAMPFALGSLFNKAYGKSTDLITDTLNFALTLEYLEAEFYTMAVSMSTFPTESAKNAFITIRDHENAHVNFLKTAITAANGTPVPKPKFDFSGGKGSGTGPFATAFSNYSLLLTVAQAFEDTGVRAYKGQAGNLITNNDVLTAALNIHSVEARHASHIRWMRMNAGQTANKPWITGKQSPDPMVQAIYDGEDLAVQGGVTITGLGGISANAATEAFDEPLTKDQVLKIVEPFIVP
ncbi:MAG: ferritin-like domain-containing protein [Sphingobacteriales bacterium]|nr:MAG: ferritin-like domain-containing protein [Sphingobacteriales bacterium]